ncbi:MULTISPECIES: tyrosine-type recombinase/integrase [unclassified Streptomyces]|uniref:tyrosine-type recombinase/integrase n=1 Tax=unclassified Streptomyces TaxID=2593676 RepID=UPI0033C45AC6
MRSRSHGALTIPPEAKDREKWGTAWVETERVFTKENGEMLHPANVTQQFIEVYEEIGLPPVRLHDLHHGAATLARAGGADLKAIQEMLGHSSITTTADTYTSLLPEADLAVAEAAAQLVPRARATSENTPSKRRPSPTTWSIPARSTCRMMLIRR